MEKHLEEQAYWNDLRQALYLGIQEHNAKVNAERKAEVPETVEKRGPGRLKGSKNKR